jgi:hypothetical protein
VCLPRGVVLIALIVLGACAGQQETSANNQPGYAVASLDPESLQKVREEAQVDPILTAEALANEDDLVCVRESAVGTNIRVRRCYSRSQLNEQATETQDWLRDELSQGGSMRDGAPVNPVLTVD